MTPTFDPQRLIRTLVEHEVEFVLIGATAAWLQGDPSVTADLDITPRKDIDNAERLADALNELGARPVTRGVVGARATLDERDFLGWQPHQFITDAGAIDVLPDVAAVGDYEDLRRRAVTLGAVGATLLVASLDDVIASKELLGRPKDRLHLETLYETRSALADGPTPDRLDDA